ncbi:PREDICTED: WW domain binding protein 1-like [Myotis davidii]|uniref:WW domain binding protein 1-like n=1 Tax=Myotis davidii TaxID=225400 RepID=UPI00076780AE|nr:PREDICTED: WW domain binding protein 1-like [Myotis davidii]
MPSSYSSSSCLYSVALWAAVPRCQSHQGPQGAQSSPLGPEEAARDLPPSSLIPSPPNTDTPANPQPPKPLERSPVALSLPWELAPGALLDTDSECQEELLKDYTCEQDGPLPNSKDRTPGRHRHFMGDLGIEVCVCVQQAPPQ